MPFPFLDPAMIRSLHARLLLVVVLGAELIGCRPRVAVEPARQAARGTLERPRPDLATPESALRSYWASIDYLNVRVAAEEAADLSGVVAPVMADVATGEALISFREFRPRADRLERSVENVVTESDARALVHARVRNMTRNPPSLTPTPIELFERESAGQLRYVMAREADRWKVAEVWRLEESGEPRRIR
jgi:hypothetical protein